MSGLRDTMKSCIGTAKTRIFRLVECDDLHCILKNCRFNNAPDDLDGSRVRGTRYMGVGGPVDVIVRFLQYGVRMR